MIFSISKRPKIQITCQTVSCKILLAIKCKGNKVLNSLVTNDNSQCKGPAKVLPLSSLTDAFCRKRVRKCDDSTLINASKWEVLPSSSVRIF